MLTPSEPGIKLEKNKAQATDKDINYFQQQVGSLIYLTTHTRPEIAYSVYNCARFMSNPSKQHFTTLDRIFKYLVNKTDIELYFKATETFILKGFVDSN